ncbi:hypothetical protein [Vibrio harveyi]|uniref:Uncharacterized protein n=1 Tax=Vibrio harveyi TaxID=669 RepID=A0A8B3EGN3_VIBHA|nr:hypothetical protein [Vibrio harveyi]RIW17829.1 hypothetical protein DS957_003405 [Vibrio harveyi]
METELLPYRPTHKISIEFKAGGLQYRIIDTEYPINNNEKLSPQLPELCAFHASVPASSITDIKIHEYKRYPKVKLPEFDHKDPKKGEYWLCAIDGFDHPRVFRREAGGWQIGNEIAEQFMGRREIKALSRLYTQREVFDVKSLYRLSQNTVKQLRTKLSSIEKRAEKKAKRERVIDYIFCIVALAVVLSHFVRGG